MDTARDAWGEGGPRSTGEPARGSRRRLGLLLLWAAIAIIAASWTTATRAGSDDSAKASVTLMALVAVDHGRDFRVAWEGPVDEGGWIGIVPAGAGAESAVDKAEVDRAAAGGGSPVRVTAPQSPGEYEIIFVSGDGAVLGRRALEVR